MVNAINFHFSSTYSTFAKLFSIIDIHFLKFFLKQIIIFIHNLLEYIKMFCWQYFLNDGEL